MNIFDWFKQKKEEWDEERNWWKNLEDEKLIECTCGGFNIERGDGSIWRTHYGECPALFPGRHAHIK